MRRLLALAQPPQPPTPAGRGAAVPGGAAAGRSSTAGPRARAGTRRTRRRRPARKRVLAWADTRNGQAQHESVGHALAVIERLGYDSGMWDTFIRTDSHIIAERAEEDGRVERERRPEPE